MGNEAGDVYCLWVYDCGTSSPHALLEHALDRFAENYTAKKQFLDLVVLSHFDRDHISGVVDLLGRFEVDVLLLPFVPLAQRIILAFREGIAVDDALFSFFINPVGYLNGAGVRGVRRIVFVPSGNGEGPGPPEAGSDDPDSPRPERWPEHEDAYRLDFDSRPAPDDLFGAAGGSRGKIGSVSMLKPGSALRAASVWEFVPYNDETLALQPGETWLGKARALRDELLREKQGEQRSKLLAHLKDAYDEEFGTDSKGRNQISLFLYAGPVGASAPDGCRGNYGWTFKGDPPFIASGELIRGWRAADRPGERAGALYTGDGYLDTKARVDALLGFMGNARIGRTAVFQVMHHGAAANWTPGVASAIGPWFSVFSSDPNHRGYGHPHAEVLRDFWLCGPVQVKADSDAQIHVWWEW
ncbi:MAG TPA: hypothetical protein VFK29_05640 [Rhodanobacteraceae bacterium]|nr:hypothetical protein [Rhodanobacteraceae bacterium]